MTIFQNTGTLPVPGHNLQNYLGSTAVEPNTEIWGLKPNW